jgi:hypothetical protein
MLNMHDIMLRMAARHPAFASHAAFRDALTETLRDYFDIEDISKEWRPPRSRGAAIDVRFTRDGLSVVAALHYVTAATGQEDVARASFWRDIQRIERMVSTALCDSGYVIMLTGQPSLWTASGRPAANEAAFDTGEGHHFRGAHAGANGEPVVTQRDYFFQWLRYGGGGLGRTTEFRYLIVRVDAD